MENYIKEKHLKQIQAFLSMEKRSFSIVNSFFPAKFKYDIKKNSQFTYEVKLAIHI
jgi:hypothetical protein